jgi:hypothetical protein
VRGRVRLRVMARVTDRVRDKDRLSVSFNKKGKRGYTISRASHNYRTRIWGEDGGGGIKDKRGKDIKGKIRIYKQSKTRQTKYDKTSQRKAETSRVDTKQDKNRLDKT